MRVAALALLEKEKKDAQVKTPALRDDVHLQPQSARSLNEFVARSTIARPGASAFKRHNGSFDLRRIRGLLPHGARRTAEIQHVLGCARDGFGLHHREQFDFRHSG